MPSSFSTAKNYEKQATGENAGTWGTLLNDNFISLVDANLAGVTSLTLTNLNVLLSAAQAAKAKLRLNGMLTGSVIVTNNCKGFYLVENLTTGAFNVTISNGVSSVVVPQNSRAVLGADTTSGVRIMGIAGATTPDSIPVGTKMLFAQSAVPTGWTLDTTYNDYMVKLATTGNVTSGTLDFSTVFGTTAVGGFTLAITHLPAHQHTLTTDIVNAGTGALDPPGKNWSPIANSNVIAKDFTQSIGGGGSHAHAFDIRLRALAVIMGTRAL